MSELIIISLAVTFYLLIGCAIVWATFRNFQANDEPPIEFKDAVFLVTFWPVVLLFLGVAILADKLS